MDPETSYMSPDSVVREIHGDLPGMLIGGLSSLLVQMLHPEVVAGVAQHSLYKEDPFGRLDRTAQFIGVTSYGSKEEAGGALDLVRRVHGSVSGVSSRGRAYTANDPELITWVHVIEAMSFLAGAQLYGARRFSGAEQDEYYSDMARVAYDLGAQWVPTSRDEVREYLDGIQGELELSPEARDTRNFLMLGVARHLSYEIPSYALLLGASSSIMPRWAKQKLGLISVPAVSRLAIRPMAGIASRAVRWVALGESGSPERDRRHPGLGKDGEAGIANDDGS